MDEPLRAGGGRGTALPARHLRHVPSAPGYTLIELLVALSIFGVLAGVAIPHLKPQTMNVW